VHWINTYLATVLVQTRTLAGVEESLTSMLSDSDVRVEMSHRGWVELEFCVEGRNVAHACATAAALARAATGAEPIACHVITLTEHAALMAAAGQIDSGRHARVEQLREHRVPIPRLGA
jgi:hypothetical protein